MAGASGTNRVLVWIAFGCFVLASPCALMGVLGLLGIVADVSPAENREIGVGSLLIAAVPAGLGVVILGVVGWRRRRIRSRA